MIDLAHFEDCVCIANGRPHGLCQGKLSFEEKGRKVKLSIRTGEEAKAIVIDGCICTDNDSKCDGLFLFRQGNKNWMILVELKGTDLDRAFGQLAYTRNNRREYSRIRGLFMQNQTGRLYEVAFIVSNKIPDKNELQKLENAHGLRLKACLHSEATKPIPDIRENL